MNMYNADYSLYKSNDILDYKKSSDSYNSKKDTYSTKVQSSSYNIALAKMIVTTFTVLALLVIVFLITPHAATGKTQPKTKYFKSIEIQYGDTLWSIANEYMGTEYKHVNDYIKELKKMNGLVDDHIQAGNYLVVSYYSEEVK